MDSKGVMDANEVGVLLRKWYTSKVRLGILGESKSGGVHLSFIGAVDELAERVVFRSVGVDGASALLDLSSIRAFTQHRLNKDSIGPLARPEKVKMLDGVTVFAPHLKDEGVLTFIELPPVDGGSRMRSRNTGRVVGIYLERKGAAQVA